ncbi:hypothetical protein SMD22_01155 (plasmid) [Brevibacillus halotolerans]|nr:hypothetical protein SMD22_01155 [Brevibacillus halotolerans]
MWTKEDVIISLNVDKVPKWKIASFLRLEKPWNRYKREELAEIVSYEATKNESICNTLKHYREQRLAKEELNELYFRYHNTAPPISLNGSSDWVYQLKNYKKTQRIP